MTLVPEVERAVLDAVRRHHQRRQAPRWSRLRSTRMRLPVVAIVALLGTTTIALAASGVILTGSPVPTHGHGSARVGFGIPAPGESRLLPLRAPDPAGGLPWGMRIIRTTRGYLCIQIGRVEHGELGELGIDGAFRDDGRFHPLPASALPDELNLEQRFDIDCEAGNAKTFAGDIVRMEPSAASNPRPGVGSPAGRREISYGLLGRHALSVTYRAGGSTHSSKVLPGLGAYLIVQRAASGRRLGGISDAIGGPESPASPNGALTSITYRYGKKTCTDTGHGDVVRACGLHGGPPPKPVPLPAVHEPLHVHLRIRRHTVTSAQIAFRAPYPVRNVSEGYEADVFAKCLHVETGGSLQADVAKDALVHIAVGSALSYTCNSRSMTFKLYYDRELNGVPAVTPLGTVTVHIPRGTHPIPLPPRLRERLRKNARRAAHH